MDAPPDPDELHALIPLVRHGQTSANLEGVWHGSTNTSLTPHGRRQAEAVSAHIHAHLGPVEHVYSSPLERAHHTALAIAKPLGLEPTLEDDLVEYDLGTWEGLSFRTLWEDKKLFENMKIDPGFRPHGGEAPKQVGDRLAGALTRISCRHPGGRVVVVTHGGALSIALGILLDDDYRKWERMMKNCAISELSLATPARLLSFNRTEHLPPEDPPSHTR